MSSPNIPRRTTVPRALPAALATLLCASAAGGAPHPRDVGDGVARLRATTFLSGWGYDDSATRVEDPPFTAQTVALQVEAGVAPRLTLTGALPYVWIPASATRTPTTGDATVGALVALLDGAEDPLDLALSLDVKLPLYDGAPTVRGRDAAGRPAIGDGQVDVTAGAVLASSLPLGGGLDVYLGYRMRTGDITDAVVGGGRIGLWLLDKRFFASVFMDTVVTMVPDAQAPGPKEVIGRGYAAIGPRVSVRVVDRIFLDVGGAYVGRGTNAPGGFELLSGVSAGF